MSLFGSMVNSTKSAISFNGINLALTGYFGLDAYQEARQSGAGTMGAIGSGITAAALPMLIPGGIPGYLAFEAATSAPGLAVDAYRWQNSYRRQLGNEQRQRAFQQMSFQDNQQTFTMRQSAMAIAQRSRYNTAAAMQGREAQYFIK